MKNKVIYLLLMFLLISLVSTGCERMGQVKGVKERNNIENEPEIIVKDNNGEKTQLLLEKYISGVVAGEMNKDWPENAYGAQAILARTFALRYMEENDTDIISSSFSEAQEYSPQKITNKISKAVKNTRGEVVLFDDEYIKGWFHASAGGQTTSAKVGLAYSEEEPKYVKSVKSPDNKAPDDIRNWEIEFSENEIKNALKKIGENVGDIESFKIKEKDNTGRAIEFVFTGSKGEATIKAANFRKQLGSKKLKSTKIKSIKKINDSFKISGSGFGHGVGMSQWGAYSLALDNKNPEEIIKYYYKNIEIKKLYE